MGLQSPSSWSSLSYWYSQLAVSLFQTENFGFREPEVATCARFVHNMDGAVKFLMDTSVDQTKKHMGHYKKEFQKIGQAFHAFGSAMNNDGAGEIIILSWLVSI